MFNFTFVVNGIKDQENLYKAMEALQEANLDNVDYITISTSIIEDTKPIPENGE